MKIIVKATDNVDTKLKYYYKIEDGNYVEVDKDFKLDIDGKYKVTIKVVDQTGNYIEVEKEIDFDKIKTEMPTEEEKDDQTENGDGNGGENTPENPNKPTNSDEPTNPDKPNDPEKPNEESKPEDGDKDDEGEDPEEEEIKIPEINLDKVPSRFGYKEKYKVPSYYKFDSKGGEVECLLDGKEKIEDTSNLSVGKHAISCEAIGNNGYTTRVEKEVEVIIPVTEDEFFDGWITMNLYYPENSTDWQWRLGNENEIRTGYDNTDWQDYTGPITVKLSDVENVYIRYKMNGETIIIPPKGKILVDIQPASYTIYENQNTRVSIVYEKGADIKEYRINNGNWQTYEGSFEVSANTLIEARVIKDIKVYDSEGEYVNTVKKQSTDSVFIGQINPIIPDDPNSPENVVTTIGGIPIGTYNHGGGTWVTSPWPGSTPTYHLAGPIIKATPSNEIAEEVKVEVIPQETARKTYIKIGGGSWQEYTGTITVDKNITIVAYYIRQSDGKVSNKTYYNIQNIKVDKLPYVRLDVTPSKYLSETVEKATVTISGSDYDTLEYSFDGNIYYSYTSPIEVTTSSTVYGRGTNEFGQTVENIVITTKKPSVKKEELDVSIFLDPTREEVEGLINKVKVSIDYDSRATKKYYKLGNGSLKEYTGEFEMTINETITAYAISDTGYGEAIQIVDFLTTGIAAPVINTSPEKIATSAVKVTIDYPKTATVKKYKIDNGSYIDYTESLTIDENCRITAYTEDGLGNSNISYKEIKNIIELPNYTLIDKGKYFVLRLNYPSTAAKDAREYKWTPNGEWKLYDEELAILLIKSEYKDLISEDGVKIEDDLGNEIIYTDHYYLVDAVTDDLSEYLFMRWDAGKPEMPQILLDTTDPAKEVTVTIKPDKNTILTKYKIVSPDGEDSGWKEYTDSFKIKENNTVIYAKSQNESEVWSKVKSIKITNIDTEKPTLSVIGDFVNPKQKVILQINGRDDLAIDKVGYVKGNKDEKYILENAEFLSNYGTFVVTENGEYTVCAVDKAGNITTEVIEITNIDVNAPDISINILTKTYGTTAEFEIDYGDSTTKMYKVGTNGTYKNYTEKVTLLSNDVLSLANDDKTLTIYAKGKDVAGNEVEVEEIVYVLDLDAPKTPGISVPNGYPVLTDYGMQIKGQVVIDYDKRDDIINYYSIDNTEDWKVYTGPFSLKGTTVYAKSVKKDTKLTISSSKTVATPSDALKPAAYDGSTTTYDHVPQKSYRRFYVDPSMSGKSFSITAYRSNAGSRFYSTMKFYGASGNLLHNIQYDYNVTYNNSEIAIPVGTTYIDITPGVFDGRFYDIIYEIDAYNSPRYVDEKVYPILTDQGVVHGYSNIKINYHETAVKKYYKINDGEWKTYKGKIKSLAEGTVVSAYSIDKYNKTSITSSYNVALASDALNTAVYDEITTSGINSSGGTVVKYLTVDPSAWNYDLNYIYNAFGGGSYGDSSVTIEFLGQNNILLDSVVNKSNTSQNGTATKKINVPSETYRIRFTLQYGRGWGGSCNSKLYEIYLTPANVMSFSLRRPEQEVKVTNPKFFVTNSTSLAKEITINYVDGYTNEYSLDNGKTWQVYNGPINILENGTIIARSMNGENVVASSSRKITTIEIPEIIPETSIEVPIEEENVVEDTIEENPTTETKEEINIELEIPNEIEVGSDYKLPTSTNANSCVCKIGDVEYTTTKELEIGNYTINCVATTDSGLTKEITKEIDVVEIVGEENED